MFIYTGKLHWEPYGVNELLVMVLPNGPARVGDSVFIHSQWTVDAKGEKNKKWSQYQTINKVTRAENGDDTFHFGKGYYTFEVQAQQSYRTVSLTMSNPAGFKKNMGLERTYLTDGDVSANEARIWTGSLCWPQLATDEPLVVIVPEGFGPGKPVLAIWQWTVDASKQRKVNCIRTGSQEDVALSGSGAVGFRLAADYSMTCTWDEKTEKLSVCMQGPDNHSQDVGPLDLGAVIKLHSYDITPPQLPGETVELEVHYPQAEPALTRIQSPLPFPATLIETLTYTAAFLDQAGYQAKYAIDQYHGLHKAYHSLLHQSEELNEQIRALKANLATLTGENEHEKHEIENLRKQLADTVDAAGQKEAALTKQLQDLQMILAKEKSHDAEDHKALDAAHEQIRKEQEAKTTLQNQVIQLKFALDQAAITIKQVQAQVSELAHEASYLRGQLEVEKAHNAELQQRLGDMKNTVETLEADAAAVKRTLARTTEELEEVRAHADDKDKIIEGLEKGMEALKKDRDANKHAYQDLKKSTSATIQDLQDQLAKLKASGQAQSGTSGGGGTWLQVAFPGGLAGAGWPIADQLLRQSK